VPLLEASTEGSSADEGFEIRAENSMTQAEPTEGLRPDGAPSQEPGSISMMTSGEHPGETAPPCDEQSDPGGALGTGSNTSISSDAETSGVQVLELSSTYEVSKKRDTPPLNAKLDWQEDKAKRSLDLPFGSDS
jgi:hypothetical protein